MFVIKNPELEAWVKTATNSEIELALIYGYRNVPDAKKLSAPKFESMVEKGNIGEKYVEEVLTEFCKVKNVAKNPKSGDLTLFLESRKIIVEVKNYSNSVPTSTVEKFRRDLSTAGADGGVFISLHSSINLITDSVKIIMEQSDYKQVPCIYIVGSDKNMIGIAVNLIYSLIKILNDKYVNDTTLSNLANIREDMDKLSKIRSQILTDHSEFMTKLVKGMSRQLHIEGTVRDSIDIVSDELDYNSSVVPLKMLEKNSLYCKLDDDTRKAIATIINAIDEKNPVDAHISWKISAKKVIHSTGAGILFGRKTQFTTPCSRISNNTLAALVSGVKNKNISVDNGNLSIDISKDTIVLLTEVIQEII